MRYKSIFMLLLVVGTFSFSSCKKKERNLQTLRAEMERAGFEGHYEQPQSQLEKTALAWFGIEDVLIYRAADNQMVIAKLKDDSFSDATLDNLINLAKRYIPETEQAEIDLDQIKEKMYRQTPYVLFWEREKPDELIKILRKY